MGSGPSLDRSSFTSAETISAESWNHPAAIQAAEAERLLSELASVFLNPNQNNIPQTALCPEDKDKDKDREEPLTNSESIYRNLVEQIPAVIFRAHLTAASEKLM